MTTNMREQADAITGIETAPKTMASWVAAELPSPYADLVAKIAAVREEAAKIEAIGAVLWQTGAPLVGAVRQAFAGMGFPSEPVDAGAGYDALVPIDGARRLLLEIIGGPDAIDRRSLKITQLLQAIQWRATDQDRVILVVNAHCNTPVRDRNQEPVSADALKLMVGVGATVVTTSTLFAAWKYSRQAPADAQKAVRGLHAHAGGIFR